MTHQVKPDDSPGGEERLDPNATAMAGLTNAGGLDRVGTFGIPPLAGPGSTQAAVSPGAPGFYGGEPLNKNRAQR